MTESNRPGRLWWDALLDGYPHEVDAMRMPGFEERLTLFRAAVYREAEIRHLQVRTSKLRWQSRLRVQAFGHHGGQMSSQLHFDMMDGTLSTKSLRLMSEEDMRPMPDPF